MKAEGKDVFYSNEGQVRFKNKDDYTNMLKSRRSAFFSNQGLIYWIDLYAEARVRKLLKNILTENAYEKVTDKPEFTRMQVVKHGSKRLTSVNPKKYLRVISNGFARILVKRNKETNECVPYPYTCTVGHHRMKKKLIGDGFVYDVPLEELFSVLVDDGSLDYTLNFCPRLGNQYVPKEYSDRFEDNYYKDLFSHIQPQGWILKDKNYHFGNVLTDILVIFGRNPFGFYREAKNPSMILPDGVEKKDSLSERFTTLSLISAMVAEKKYMNRLMDESYGLDTYTFDTDFRVPYVSKRFVRRRLTGKTRIRFSTTEKLWTHLYNSTRDIPTKYIREDNENGQCKYIYDVPIDSSFEEFNPEFKKTGIFFSGIWVPDCNSYDWRDVASDYGYLYAPSDSQSDPATETDEEIVKKGIKVYMKY